VRDRFFPMTLSPFFLLLLMLLGIFSWDWQSAAKDKFGDDEWISSSKFSSGKLVVDCVIDEELTVLLLLSLLLWSVDDVELDLLAKEEEDDNVLVEVVGADDENLTLSLVFFFSFCFFASLPMVLMLLYRDKRKMDC
jgi:hypothetical protein